VGHQTDKRTLELPEGLQYLAYAAYVSFRLVVSMCCWVQWRPAVLSGRQMAQPY